MGFMIGSFVNRRGYVLMRGYSSMRICQRKEKPGKIIFYHIGIKIAVRGSGVFEDLQQLAKERVNAFVCGTCPDYFDLTKDIGVGIVSNTGFSSCPLSYHISCFDGGKILKKEEITFELIPIL